MVERVNGRPRMELKVVTLIGCLVILIGTVITIGVSNHHRGTKQPSVSASTTTSSVPPTGLVPVPNVVGLKMSQAAGALQAVGLTNSIDELCDGAVASGVVVSQSPQAGFHAATGSRISLRVSCSGSTPSTPVTPEGVTLGPDGLGIVIVGDSQETVVSTITQALGAPTVTGGSACKDRTEVHWGDLSLEFYSGTLDGYRYLNGSQTLMGSKAPTPAPNTPLLRTDAGATLGMKLGQVQPLYPPGDFTMEHGGSVVVAGSKAGDRLLLEFGASSPSTPLWEIKGGAPCGDF